MNKADQKDSWQSPPEIFLPLHHKFDFKFDMAASDTNHLLPLYYTKENSALNARWSKLDGWKWCNPPYSDPMPWVQAASRGRRVVMLLNQDTSTKWARRARKKANLIILLDWRVKFIHAVTGKRGPSNNKCQQILIFDEKPPKGKADVVIMSLKEFYAYCNYSG